MTPELEGGAVLERLDPDTKEVAEELKFDIGETLIVDGKKIEIFSYLKKHDGAERVIVTVTGEKEIRRLVRDDHFADVDVVIGL